MQEYALPSTPRRAPVTPRRNVNTPRDPLTPREQALAPSRASAVAAAKRAFAGGPSGGTEDDSFNSVQTSEQSFAGPFSHLRKFFLLELLSDPQYVVHRSAGHASILVGEFSYTSYFIA